MRHPKFRSQPTYELPVRWDFSCRTNSDYTEELSFQNGSDYLDLTDHSFEIQIRSAPNATTILKTLDTVSSAASEGLFPVEADRGAIQFRVFRTSLLSLYQSVYPNIMEGDEVSLYYDLLVTLPSGDREAWLSGYFNIDKGITNG